MDATTFSQIAELVRELISGGSLIIEFLGAVTIAIAVAKLLFSGATLQLLFLRAGPGVREANKHQFGTVLLMGMDFLVAGDVIKSVALELTLPAISALALLVIVRTFLSWSILVEIEGRWPWQPRRAGDAARASS